MTNEAIPALFLPVKRFQCFCVKGTSDWQAPVTLESLYCGSCFCAHQSVRRANVVTMCPKPLLSVRYVLFVAVAVSVEEAVFAGAGSGVKVVIAMSILHAEKSYGQYTLRAMALILSRRRT